MTGSALVLEVDGVVFDTARLRTVALHDALAAEGIAVAPELVANAHLGSTAAMALDALALTSTLDAVTHDLVLRRAADALRAAFERSLPFFHIAARDAVERLATEFPLAVVSRAEPVHLARMLEQAGLESSIRAIRTLGDLPVSAHPQVWADAAGRLHAHRVIAVAPAPLLPAARSAGLRTVAIGAPAGESGGSLVSLTRLDAPFLASLP